MWAMMPMLRYSLRGFCLAIISSSRSKYGIPTALTDRRGQQKTRVAATLGSWQGGEARPSSGAPLYPNGAFGPSNTAPLRRLCNYCEGAAVKAGLMTQEVFEVVSSVMKNRALSLSPILAAALVA